MNDVPISPEIWKLAALVLTAKQRTVLELREIHGYSWNQLAICTNTGKATVREHHRAATKNLHDVIEVAGGDVELALRRAMDLPDHEPVVVHMESNRVAFAQPRPASEKKENA